MSIKANLDPLHYKPDQKIKIITHIHVDILTKKKAKKNQKNKKKKKKN
jgi:hypothetical protein